MEIIIGFTDNITGRLQSQPFGQCGAPFDETRFGILDVNSVWYIVQQRIEQVAFIGELLLHLVPFGHIPKHALDAIDLSLGIEQGGFDRFDIDVFLATSGASMDFGGVVDFPGFHDAHVVAAIFVSEMFWGKIVICFPENILQRFADGLAKLLVGENKGAFAVFPNNVLRNGFDQ